MTQEQMKNFLLEKLKDKAPIVREHRRFVILAQNENDFKVKEAAINRGDIRGFYKVPTQ